MKIKLILLLAAIFFVNISNAQLPDSLFLRIDSVSNGYAINLATVTVMDIKNNDLEERRAFYRAKHAVNKVYPYARQALATMKQTDSILATLDKKRQQRKYMRIEEKELKNDYKSILKDLYVEEGRVLIKIIERETGAPFYETLKKYKGNATAAWWNAIANLNGYSLKDGYDPEKEKYLEIILQSKEKAP